MAIYKRQTNYENNNTSHQVNNGSSDKNTLEELSLLIKGILEGTTAGEAGVTQNELDSLVSKENTNELVDLALGFSPAGIVSKIPKLGSASISGRNISNVEKNLPIENIAKTGYDRVGSNLRGLRTRAADETLGKRKNMFTPEQTYRADVPLQGTNVTEFRALKDMADSYGGYGNIAKKLGLDESIEEPTIILDALRKTDDKVLSKDFSNAYNNIQNKLDDPDFATLMDVINTKNKTGKTINPLFSNRALDSTKRKNATDDLFSRTKEGLRDSFKTKSYYTDKLLGLDEAYEIASRGEKASSKFGKPNTSQNYRRTQEAIADYANNTRAKLATAPTESTAALEGLGLAAAGSIIHPLAAAAGMSAPYAIRALRSKGVSDDIANEIIRLSEKQGIPYKQIEPYLKNSTTIDRLLKVLRDNNVAKIGSQIGVNQESTNYDTQRNLDKLIKKTK